MRGALPWLVAIAGCSGGDTGYLELQKRGEKACPRVSLERLAGDWVQVVGATADGSIRMRVEQTADGYRAYHVAGLDRRVLEGQPGERDLVLAEVGGTTRLRVEPWLSTCALVVSTLDADGQPIGEPVEFLELPDLGVRFAYAPWTEPLVVTSPDGGPPRAGDLVGELVTPVTPEDAACAMTVDAWLDGVGVAQDVATGEAGEAGRRWTWTWSGVAAGEHVLELTRRRACGDVVQTLGVAGARVVVAPGG